MFSGDTIARVAYTDVPLPMCILDDACRLVDFNGCAQAYWGLAEGALGGPALDALRLRGPDGEADALGRLALALRTGTPVAAAVQDGEVPRPVILVGAPVPEGEGTLTLLIVLERERSVPDKRPALPEWTRTDALTGLMNRHGWNAVAARWDGGPGVVACLHIDRLKAINESRGWAIGDALLSALGAAMRAVAPADGLALRLEGNVFALVLPRADMPAAEAWVRGVEDALEQLGATLGLPVRVRYGLATWEAGKLALALLDAVADLNASQGLALAAASGGRILLTAVPPAVTFFSTASPAVPAGPRAQGYYLQWREQAEDFVAFADPPLGGAVVEVGAGAGRITFEGGLAQRIGPDGALLVTEPDARRLARARTRAAGIPWLHFVQAGAESLPVASGTVDMVIGALFLHLCEAPQAVREMARLLRPGGRVALAAALEFPWSPFWAEVLEPIRLAQAAAGRSLPQPLLAFGALEAMLQATGLELERAEVSRPQQLRMEDVSSAIAVWRRLGVPELLLAGVDPAHRESLLAECEERLVAGFDRVSARLRALEWRCLCVMARRPG